MREYVDIATVEECQYKCNLDLECFHFKFDEESSTCSMYGEDAIGQYEYNDQLMGGPRECESMYMDT